MSPRDRSRRPSNPLPKWTGLAVVLLVGAAIYFVYQWMSTTTLDQPDPDAARLRVEVIRNAIGVGAGVGGLAALFLAFRRHQHNEHHDTEQRIADLRIKAVDQLGSERSAVRIGGLHNLERLAEQHPSLRQLVINELCAYLRMPYTPHAARGSTSENDGADDASTPSHQDPAATVDRDEEREVRLTAQRILTRHLRQPRAETTTTTGLRRIRAGMRRRSSSAYWDHDSIDLTGAYLYSPDFENAELHNVVFTGVTLTGDAKFERTVFIGNAKFERTVFIGNAKFERTVFAGDADFERTAFNSRAGFERTVFMGNAEFAEARFLGEAGFGGARADGVARFLQATFRGDARFWEVTFKNDTAFTEARFERNAWFMHAAFNGYTWFRDARFSDDVGFDEATFAGLADFSKAAIAGDATFGRAAFKGDGEFIYTTILGDARFDAATFVRDAMFEGATIRGDARFDAATFQGVATVGLAEFTRGPVGENARAVIDDRHEWPANWCLLKESNDPGWGRLVPDSYEVAPN